MTTEITHVPGISCAHCVKTIEREIGELEGVESVSADLESKRVTFRYEAPATPPKLKAAMEEIGYPVVEGLGSNRSA